MKRRTKQRAWHRALELLEERRLLALTVSVATPVSGDTNLTQTGVLDWAHWGYPNDPSAFIRKLSVSGPRISNFTTIGGGAVTAADIGKTFTWTEFTPGETDVTTPATPFVRVSGTNDGDAQGGLPPAGEDVDKAIDNTTSKYLNFADFDSGVIVSPSVPTTVTGLRIYTANDSPERDPASYRVEGSNDGVNWSPIAEGALALPDGRNDNGLALDPLTQFNELVTFSNTVAYTNYRVTFPTIKNATAANAMQVGEIELIGTMPPNATATSDAIATSGAGNGFQVAFPAGVLNKRLELWVAADGGTGQLSASLSDSDAPPTVRTLVDDIPSGPKVARYSIEFSANSNNQTLSIDWVAQSGAVILAAAALTPPPGVLSVSSGASSGDTNLSVEGNLDWAHWGYPGSAAFFNRKPGVPAPRINNFTVLGPGAVTAYTTPAKTFTWTDFVIGTPADITSISDAVVRVDGTNDGDISGGNPPAGEEAFRLFDNTTTKYLNFKDLNSGAIVTPAVGATVVTGVRIYTANDSSERDPASYTLEGSNDGVSWAVISQGALALPTTRNLAAQALNPATQANQLVAFANSTPFVRYRITFPTLRNAATANSMQVGEVELIGTLPSNATATPDAVAITGVGSGFRLTIPASTAPRRVKLYVGVDGENGRLTATLADGSATPVIHTLVDDNPSGAKLAVYTIDVRSGYDAQSMTLDWIAPNGGTAILSAVTWVDIAPPTAANGVTVTPTGKGRMNVSWNDLSINELGFKIERAPDVNGNPGDFELVGAAPVDATQFADGGLSGNTKYHYRVTAFNAIASALPSASASGVTRADFETGFNGKYYNDQAMNSLFTTRNDPQINFDFGTEPIFPGMPGDNFGIRWDGTFVADFNGPHTFFTDTDDGGRLYLDVNQNDTFDFAPPDLTTPNGELIVNAWETQSPGELNGATNGRGLVVNLVAGQSYKIRMEMFEGGGGAAARLYLKTPHTADVTLVAGESVMLANANPPKVTAFAFDKALPAGPLYTPASRISITFSKDVSSTLDVSDLSINGLASGTISGGQLQLYHYDNVTHTAIFTFLLNVPGLAPGELPDDRFTLTILADGVRDSEGNPLAGDNTTAGTNFTQGFYKYRGDTQLTPSGAPNANEKADFSDFQRLERNFGKLQPAPSDGDLDYDGDVDHDDFLILFQRMNTTLPPAPAIAPAKPAIKPVKKPAKPLVPAKPVVRTPAPVKFSVKKVAVR